MKSQIILKQLAWLFLILFSTGCKDLYDQDMYKRPEWLPGKLYTSVKAQDNLSLFAEWIEISGLDTILDVSGSWTIFAPDNEAVKQFMTENHYASAADIPAEELERLVKFHVIQNPWSLEQLQKLSPNGWRTGTPKNSSAYAWKRQTMLKNPVEKYWIKKVNRKDMVVMDSVSSYRYKRGHVESRKYVPIFYDEFLAHSSFTPADYSFYFGRPYEAGNVFYAGAKIIKADLFAENGFVHIIDRVVPPMLNAKEMLDRETQDESYKLFLEMALWYYPEFAPNIAATYSQPEVKLGAKVDTLWDIRYPDFEFNLHSELIGVNTPVYYETLVRHNGMFVPTDQALNKFIDGLLTIKSGYPHWADIRSLPKDVADLIVARNLKAVPMYPSNDFYKQIFREQGRYYQDEESIIRREFGSNCTFIGVDNYIPDRVFTSVTGPVFCRPNYSIFRLALQYSDADDLIATHPGELYFFPIPDYALRTDSSLILNWIDKNRNIYNFSALDRKRHDIVNINYSTLKNWMLNQVGTPVTSDASKTVFRTLAGNYITWNHSTNTIQGRIASTFGYNSYETRTNTPSQPFEEPTDNGKVMSVEYWFKF